MSTNSVPPLLRGLVDDAAVFPPGNLPLAEAVPAHREHRASWYAPLVGPLLVPASAVASVPDLLDRAGYGAERLEIGVVADVPVADIPAKLRLRTTG